MDKEFTAAFFDDASKAWTANKRRVGASYVYRCIHIGKKGVQCKNVPWKGDERCYFHCTFLEKVPKNE